MIVALMAVMVLLLPILLPAAAVSEAWNQRGLARTRCKSCGHTIGLEAIRRAEQEARARGAATISAALAALKRPRIVVMREVTCPTCGHQYIYGADTASRRVLVSKGSPQPSGQTA